MLSDGADTGSATSAAAVAAKARKARVRVFTVGLRSPQFTSAPLRNLGARTSGGVCRGDVVRTISRAIYGQLGTRLANEYLLRYRSVGGSRSNGSRRRSR